MFPTASDVEGRIRKVLQHPDTVTEDDLMVLGRALLLCLRDDDHGISNDYAERSNGADLQQEVTESLTRLPVSPTNPTIDPLLATFERDEQFYEAMHALIAMTFPRLHSSKINPATLRPMQMEVLTRLAAAESIWECDMTLRDRLTERGLPLTKHELNRLLAMLPLND